MDYFSSNFKLGILGGGQLGKMLLSETRKFDIYTKVLDPSNEAPCKISANEFVQGDLMDYETVYNFGKDIDLLTVEIENINIDALKQLEQEGLKVYPQPDVLEIIRNKRRQKQFYATNNIPTSPFTVYNSVINLKEAINSKIVSLPFVWKSTEFGYDGMGVKIVRNNEDLASLADFECIAETLVDFENELAVIVSRNRQGDIKTYPVVEMEFHPEANQVEYVICPARISDDIAKKAQETAKKVAKAYNHVGLLAVEMFQTKSDEILVNEVAPRPHNSGHYSIEASYTSQFEQHIRAILNLPLGSTESKAPGIMVNLVGSENHNGEVFYENIDKILNLKGVTPHIYGKKITRPFRKMGHVTIINENIQTAREIAKKVKETINVISK